MKSGIDFKVFLIVSAVVIASLTTSNKQLLIVTAVITVLFVISAHFIRKVLY